jgi:hypothetical protein
MKANELIRRYSRAAQLAAEVAGTHATTESYDAEQLLVLLESLLRSHQLVAAKHGCPHDVRHIAWDQPTHAWRCTCGQEMLSPDGSTK